MGGCPLLVVSSRRPRRPRVDRAGTGSPPAPGAHAPAERNKPPTTAPGRRPVAHLSRWQAGPGVRVRGGLTGPDAA
ncbi:hypothetical protein CZ771_03045 [Actinomycetales bacterium JB111]|nr:hypothetical protein CZ771_03045 [Actinomycetales bacterium JB111]